MNVFVYPCQAESMSRFQALQGNLGIQSVCFWRWDDLHRKLEDLIASGTNHHPVHYGVQVGMAGIYQDMIVVHGATGTDIRRLMEACRGWRRRPIIAVATKQSAKMSLAVLFEHLTYDRAHEEQLRQQQAQK